MPVTPEELKQVIDDFDNAHSPIVRALADLFLRGHIVLEEHFHLETTLDNMFGDFILDALKAHGMTGKQLAAAVRGLEDRPEIRAVIVVVDGEREQR